MPDSSYDDLIVTDEETVRFAFDEQTTDCETTPDHDYIVYKSTDGQLVRGDLNINYVKLTFCVFIGCLAAFVIGRLIMGGK